KVQSPKGKNTYMVAKNQIENHLRPWFKANCIFLDTFVGNFEEFWADYKLSQSYIDPKRKLTHDRRILAQSLKRAYRKGWLSRDFKYKDFSLNEPSEPIGKYIEDEDVRKLVLASKRSPRHYLQI